ncbi:NAD(P)/FAD-dependent oxidoreductase [Aneurinibacillus sp. Ricciae_BoGa-3]|uniref:phytoene desaturase family protein n=1 Tax=Aneurinibacillus sp. Ricciae_BoGa-3 TaxID=3022697 RepID=UPI00234044E8|nr:NAD(P)/FAD-dependent oxidoreductase [Aneurinibacillus sp. Ricciae_BoGa-3]WCK55685.1 NAD(P)/FAD-dependent oxidoreductase [Aneurinibacillus sp. Ricciae_BoGa-3]
MDTMGNEQVEKIQANKMFDVIVIGSGIGGLAAAVELAATGLAVLVVEQHYLYGGACTTYTRRGGFKFDAGVESISGLGQNGPVRHFLLKHNLFDDIKWVRNTYQFRCGDNTYSIPADFGQWRDRLASLFPDEAAGIHKLFHELKSAYFEMYDAFAADRITVLVPQTEEEIQNYAAAHPHFLRWRRSTWRELLDAFIKAPLLRSILSMLTGYVGDLGEETPASSMIPIMGYFIEGGFRPEGGSGVLAAKLVERLRSYGGEVVGSTKVQSILMQGGRVKGVQTDKGTFYAPVIISNADPRVTYEQLVGLENLPAVYGRKVKELTPSMSFFGWAASLDRPFYTAELISYVLPEPVRLEKSGQLVSALGIQSASAADPSPVPKLHKW